MNTHDSVNKNVEIWIGLANVSPYHNSDYEFDGAYVNIICFASSYEEYFEKVKYELEQDKIQLIELTEVDLFNDRIRDFDLSDDIKKLANEVKLTGNVCFTTFHTYDAKNEN